jgi:hypothetical protein
VSSVTRERSVLLAIERQDIAALQDEFGVASQAFTSAIESDLVRSLEVAGRALSHLRGAQQK